MLRYSELLKELESNTQECHLLLGNNFNCSIGIKINYESLFTKRSRNKSSDKKRTSDIATEESDLSISSNGMEDDPNSEFIRGYTDQKIRSDVMKAASGFVKEKIKGISQKKDERVYLLLKNFSEHCTLDYDDSHSLLLMRCKNTNNKERNIVAFQNTSLFQEKNLNESQGNIHQEIKDLREGGIVTIQPDKNYPAAKIRMKEMNKTTFCCEIGVYSEKNNKGWNLKDIEKVCDLICKEEENTSYGIQEELFPPDEPYPDVFFLHGDFDVRKDGKSTEKITQEKDAALYERLGTVMAPDEKDIVHTFTADDNRIDMLSQLLGTIVIFGSSLAEDDADILDAIQKSKIEKVYISSRENQEKDTYDRAAQFFSKEKITLFDDTTIFDGISHEETK